MKKGISLVALVVTIIVLIILTSAVILSFQDGGIIDRADQAVKDSNDAVLEEKITMMNLEYTQKLKKKFTPKTRETLKEIVKQSGIDLDKLLVYYDALDGEQHVFYKIDKVTKSEVEWFLTHDVTVGEESKTIYFLIGDINLDGEITKVDSELIMKYDSNSPVPELPGEIGLQDPYTMLIGDINCDEYYVDIPDSLLIDFASEGKIYEEIFNIIDLSIKEQQLKTYFGIE